MCKNLGVLAAAFLLVLNLSSCNDDGGESGGSSNTTSSVSETKYLAQNIIFDSETDGIAGLKPSKKKGLFNFNLVRNAYAESQAVDTETQILARNVLVEENFDSQIESDNVQDAFEEISLKLSDKMVGTWDIQNYNQEICHESTGQVVIYDDGTFDLIEGSFAAIGMGSGTAQDNLCNHREDNQTYKVYTEDLVAFTHFNGPTENSVIPRLVKLRKNEMVFIGSGGCGQVGRQRISILTRIDE